MEATMQTDPGSCNDPQQEDAMYRVESNEDRPRSSSSFPAYVKTALNNCRLLTPEGEQALFKNFNFLQNRAKALNSTLNPKRPSKRTSREIASLSEEIQSVREQIAVANLRLVASISSRLSKSTEEFDELFSEGTSILLYAIEKFDYTKGFRLSTYATQAIQRHLYRYMNRKTKNATRETTIERIDYLEREDDSDAIPYRDEKAAALSEEIINKIDEILDAREQQIVRGRFGLDGSGEAKTFQVLGDRLGLSKERARQLFNRGISKLSAEVGTRGDEIF